MYEFEDNTDAYGQPIEPDDAPVEEELQQEEQIAEPDESGQPVSEDPEGQVEEEQQLPEEGNGRDYDALLKEHENLKELYGRWSNELGKARENTEIVNYLKSDPVLHGNVSHILREYEAGRLKPIQAKQMVQQELEQSQEANQPTQQPQQQPIPIEFVDRVGNLERTLEQMTISQGQAQLNKEFTEAAQKYPWVNDPTYKSAINNMIANGNRDTVLTIAEKMAKVHSQQVDTAVQNYARGKAKDKKTALERSSGTVPPPEKKKTLPEDYTSEEWLRKVAQGMDEEAVNIF